MANKHELLYSKARQVLYYRHKRRTWFNMNPFLEITDESADLDNFVPDTEAGKVRESLVFCEKYNVEMPVNAEQMDAGRFFTYLYSDEWRQNGCSVRVVEGQLLDQLLHSLFILDKRGGVVKHKTYAFARNKRGRTGCCRNMEDSSNDVSDGVEDIVFLEFAYYAHLTKDNPNSITLNPLLYLRMSHPTDTEQTPLEEKSSEELEAQSSQPQQPVRTGFLNTEPTVETNVKADVLKEDLQNFNPGFKYRRQSDAVGSDLTSFQPDMKDRRRQSIAKTLLAGRTGSQDSRRQSLTLPPQHMVLQPVFPVLRNPLEPKESKEAKRKEATHSSLHTKRRKRVISMEDEADLDDLHHRWTRFQTKGIIDSDEDSETDSNEQVSEENVSLKQRINYKYFGEELYISEQNNDGLLPGETVLNKLRRRRNELDEVKKEGQKQLKDALSQSLKARYKQTLPPLDTSAVRRPSFHFINQGLPDALPTFDEFLRVLQKENEFDPRFKHRMKNRSRRVAKQYGLKKAQDSSSMLGQSTADLSIASDGSSLRSNRMMPRRGSIDQGRGMGRTPIGFHKPLLGMSSSKQVFANEVLGVTDSKTCKDHCLKYRAGSQKDSKLSISDISRKGGYKSSSVNKVNDIRTMRTTPDIFVISPVGVWECIHTGTFHQKTNSTPIVQPKKVVSLSTTTETSEGEKETEDEEEEKVVEEDLPDEISANFAVNKLNKHYSFERLRRKSRKQSKKKPKFFDVLKKFYKSQDSIKAFGNGPEESTGRDSSTRMLFGKSRKPSVKQPKPKEEPKVEFTLGMMRKFGFLEKTLQRNLDIESLERADFSSPSPDDVIPKMFAAMEDFILRKEIVVSQRTSKVSTSITFSLKDT